MKVNREIFGEVEIVRKHVELAPKGSIVDEIWIWDDGEVEFEFFRKHTLSKEEFDELAQIRKAFLSGEEIK